MAVIKDLIIGADGLAVVLATVVGGTASIRCSAQDAETVLSTVRETDAVSEPGELYFAGGTFHAMPARPSDVHQFDWATKSWFDPRSLADLKAQGLILVDDLAGAARLRYITSVPGQAETYAKKEQQAREWAASSFTGEPPSFIAAEANALGQNPQELAAEVIGLADYWGNTKGPQIEAARRKWKVAVEAATDAAAIPGLVESAKSELESL